jgi:hypothetical protein
MNGIGCGDVLLPEIVTTTHLVRRRNRRRLSEISWSFAGYGVAEAKRYGTITREKSHVLLLSPGTQTQTQHTDTKHAVMSEKGVSLSGYITKKQKNNKRSLWISSPLSFYSFFSNRRISLHICSKKPQ